jgi:hypothetical protein
MRVMTLREYAQQEGITIGTAYARIWNGKVQAKRVDGRWQITPPDPQSAGSPTQKEAPALQCA